VAKANMNGLGLVEMHLLLSSKLNSYENEVCIQSYIFQRNFEIQKFHKSLLFKAKHCFAK
jgi:hypothetical protein